MWGKKMRLIDYEILTRPITPPVGNHGRFSATVQFLFVEDEGGKRDLGSQFGERIGKTEGEARSKMKKDVEAWLSENITNSD